MKSEIVADQDYGIAEVLKTLGIQPVNRGASTGTVWLDTKGEDIESYSPADGAFEPRQGESQSAQGSRVQLGTDGPRWG